MTCESCRNGAGFELPITMAFQPILDLAAGTVFAHEALVRGIDDDRNRRSIVSHILAMLTDLGIQPVCEGVETAGEYAVLRDLGVTLMQGYLFARPTLAGLTPVQWPEADGRQAATG